MKRQSKSRKPARPAKKKARRHVSNPQDITQLMLRDHKPLKKLIKSMKKGDAPMRSIQAAFEEFSALLEAHAKPEEKSLYVDMEKKDKGDLRTEGMEGDTEHHIADRLVQEIRATNDQDLYRARVKVLAELVEHHIKEEEEDMIPDIRKEFELAERVRIGQHYEGLRQKFLTKHKIADNRLLVRHTRGEAISATL